MDLGNDDIEQYKSVFGSRMEQTERSDGSLKILYED